MAATTFTYCRPEDVFASEIEWSERLASLEGRVDEELLTNLAQLVQPGNIGPDDDQIPPGIEGRWEIFLLFQSQVTSEADLLALSGIRLGEIGPMRRLQARRWQENQN